MKKENLYKYILGIADNSLILGQRLGELCGHGPNLETDIACTNISLDLLGQVRSYYQYAAKIKGDGRTEDDIAMLRKERYHQRFSSDWVKRLGDGTEESHQKTQASMDDLWIYTDELFHQTEADKVMISEGMGVDVTKLKNTYYKKVNEILGVATLEIPESKYFQKGGKLGIHTEHMGYILAELQYMQRTYPNMEW